MMPFFEFEAITGNYFLMYFFTSFMYVGKRRWPNGTIGREWPQILQHLSSVSKTEQNAKENFRIASCWCPKPCICSMGEWTEGKHDGLFSSINPTELKSFFRIWHIIYCKVVCCSHASVN